MSVVSSQTPSTILLVYFNAQNMLKIGEAVEATANDIIEAGNNVAPI